MNQQVIVRDVQTENNKPWSFEEAVGFMNFPLLHGVTRRFGGYSKAPYDSMNLGLHVEDEVEDVWKNRKLVAAHLGQPVERLTCGQQVHGLVAKEVRPQLVGKGALNMDSAISNCDALYTAERQVPLLLLVADCVPVLLYDKGNHAVAVIHAGWRGTIGRLPVITLNKMVEAYGTQPEDCYVYIGPSIQQESFEVGEDIAQCFSEAMPKERDLVRLIKRPGAVKKTPHVNLQQFISKSFLNMGVPMQQITVSPTDSYTSYGCYSYRKAGGVTGRMGLFCMLK